MYGKASYKYGAKRSKKHLNQADTGLLVQGCRSRTYSNSLLRGTRFSILVCISKAIVNRSSLLTVFGLTYQKFYLGVVFTYAGFHHVITIS